MKKYLILILVIILILIVSLSIVFIKNKKTIENEENIEVEESYSKEKRIDVVKNKLESCGINFKVKNFKKPMGLPLFDETFGRSYDIKVKENREEMYSIESEEELEAYLEKERLEREENMLQNQKLEIYILTEEEKDRIFWEQEDGEISIEFLDEEEIWGILQDDVLVLDYTYNEEVRNTIKKAFNL